MCAQSLTIRLGVIIAWAFATNVALSQQLTLDDRGPKSNYFVIPKGEPFITPSANFNDRDEFAKLVYDGMSISNWDPFKEFPFAGKIVPIDNKRQRMFFLAERDKRYAEPEELNVFLDSIRCFNSDCYRDMIPTNWEWKDDQKLQCNHVVSLFRTNLFVRGIISRPIYFEFDDNDGKNSHTLAEAWSETLQKWLYFDPFYGAYSKSKNIRDILIAGDLSDVEFVEGVVNGMTLTDRRKFLMGTFKDGWHFWTVANMVAGIKFTYMNPKIYGEQIEPNVTTEMSPWNLDRKY